MSIKTKIILLQFLGGLLFFSSFLVSMYKAFTDVNFHYQWLLFVLAGIGAFFIILTDCMIFTQKRK